MKIKLSEKEEAIQSCIRYILDCEGEDFQENPSTNHVYYQALIAGIDKKEADKQLKEALSESGLPVPQELEDK